MTKTSIVAALRIILSLAIAGPAEAWPGQSSSIDCAWGGEPTECQALTMTLVHKHTLAHPHMRRTLHAANPLAPTHQPGRDEDPLASMHFE
jgi:steroid 5-alpha reductase family enzyme